VEAIPCGECFSWALQDAAAYGGTVVHGVVTTPLSSPPHRYEHAWVEREGKVYDWQTMEAQHGGRYRGKGYPIDVFYELYRPTATVQYTAGEAVGELSREGHYGPWDPRVRRNPSDFPMSPGVHELEDEGGVILRYRVPEGRPPTPTPRDRWLRKHPYRDEYMGEYFTWDPSLTIKEMLSRWADYGAKGYDDVADSLQLPTGEYFQAIYSWRDLWPYRRDDRPVSRPLIEGLQKYGWLSPLLLRIGRNRCVEIGEGNHRIRGAKELDLRYVPVRLWFVQEAPCVSDRERRERARSYELTEAAEEREEAIPEHVRFYTERGMKFNPATRSGKIRVHEHDQWTTVIDWFPEVPGYVGVVDDDKSFRGAVGGVGGYLVATRHGPDMQVEYVEVDDDYRRQGVATRLYEEALRIARERGGTLVSDSRLEREAKSFWEKMRAAGLADWVAEGNVSYYIMRPHADVLPNASQAGMNVERAFDEAFDAVEEQFPGLGTVELHEDDAAGADNGAGSERQFAYCKDGNPIVIAFASKAEALPDSHLRGLMRHEFGHALEYRYGVKALEEALGCSLPPEVERRADVIAEAVWGEPIKYDSRSVQCVGVQGERPRPTHLPDKREKLKANASERGLTGQEIYDAVADRWLAGDLRHPREIVGERPVSGPHKPRWVYDVLVSTMGHYGFPKDLERHLRRVAHTCHLDFHPGDR